MALYQDLRPLLGTFLALVANSVLYTIFSINKPIVRLTPLSLSLALASSLSLSLSRSRAYEPRELQCLD